MPHLKNIQAEQRQFFDALKCGVYVCHVMCTTACMHEWRVVPRIMCDVMVMAIKEQEEQNGVAGALHECHVMHDVPP